jgi:hypothetical protein
MDAFVLMKIGWPILSDGEYSMVEESWKLASEAQNRQQVLSGTPAVTHSVC